MFVKRATSPNHTEPVMSKHTPEMQILIMDTALRRIIAAAEAILTGEEAPTQALQEIQIMALSGLRGKNMDWPWLEKTGLPLED